MCPRIARKRKGSAGAVGGKPLTGKVRMHVTLYSTLVLLLQRAPLVGHVATRKLVVAEAVNMLC